VPEKHRSAVDFMYSEGAFSSLSVVEPLQLYRVFEREVTKGTPCVVSVPEHMRMLLFCLSGEGTVCVDKQIYTFGQSSVLYCPYTVNDITLCSDRVSAQYICVFFDVSARNHSADLLELMTFFQTADTVLYAQASAKCYTVFSEFLSELSLLSPTMMLVKGYFYQLLIVLYRLFSEKASQDSLQVGSVNAVGQTVYAIIRYIDVHLFTINNLADMAKELGYSYNYLSHLFRRKTGMTIQTYVTRKKIERSTLLLKDERYSVTEIASMLNYDCIQSFSKAFRRAMHMSPTEYRSKHLSNP